MKKKYKDYLVVLIYKGKREKMQVRAKSKIEAKNTVSKTVLNCSLYSFKSKKDFKLKCYNLRL